MPRFCGVQPRRASPPVRPFAKPLAHLRNRARRLRRPRASPRKQPAQTPRARDMTADTTTVHPTAPAQAGAITRWALEGAASLASGLLLADALGLHPHWWAGWLAPAPVLAAAVRGAAPWRARALGTIAGLVPALTTLTYYAVTTGWPIALFVIVARAMFWGGGVGFAASAARRLPAGVAVFALPAFAAGAEVLLLA